MHVRWAPTLAGLAIAFILLAFITKISFLGATCYAIGEVNIFGNTRCLNPVVYWVAWGFAVVLLLFGVRVPTSSMPSSPARSAPSPSTEPAQRTHRSNSTGIYDRWRYVAAVLAIATTALVGGALTVRHFLSDRPKDVTAPNDQPSPVQDSAPVKSNEPASTAAQPDSAVEVAPTDALPPDPALSIPATPSVPLPVPEQFRWSGRVSLADGRSVSVVVVFDTTGNAGIEWAELECGGSLTFASKAGDSYLYTEQVDYGVIGNCAPSGTVSLTPVDEGASLDFAKDTGNGVLTAQLRPF